MAEAVVVSAGFLDRFRGFNPFEGLDRSLLDDIWAAWLNALAAVESAAKLDAWLAFMKLVARSTTDTTVDDQVAEAAEKLLADGVLRDLLISVLDRVYTQKVQGVVHAANTDFLSKQEREAFEAAGIQPGVVLKIVQLLLEIWGQRQAA